MNSSRRHWKESRKAMDRSWRTSTGAYFREDSSILSLYYYFFTTQFDICVLDLHFKHISLKQDSERPHSMKIPANSVSWSIFCNMQTWVIRNSNFIRTNNGGNSSQSPITSIETHCHQHACHWLHCRQQMAVYVHESCVHQGSGRRPSRPSSLQHQPRLKRAPAVERDLIGLNYLEHHSALIRPAAKSSHGVVTTFWLKHHHKLEPLFCSSR